MLFIRLGSFLISGESEKVLLNSIEAEVPFSLKVREQNVKNPSLPVVMDVVFLKSGNVMVTKTVQMAVMRVLVVSNQNNTSLVVLAIWKWELNSDSCRDTCPVQQFWLLEYRDKCLRITPFDSLYPSEAIEFS